MGLFSKKKPEMRELPPLSVEMPEKMPEELPSYEPQFKMEPEEFRMPIEKPEPITREVRPIYVKIDKYKEALKTLAEIKARLVETEKVLNNLQKIKAEEDRELEDWRSDIEQIKEKLLSIDKELFEAYE